MTAFYDSDMTRHLNSREVRRSSGWYALVFLIEIGRIPRVTHMKENSISPRSFVFHGFVFYGLSVTD